MKKIVEAALVEDGGVHDPISFSLGKQEARGEFIGKEEFVFCGRDIMEMVFKTLDSSLSVDFYFDDGDTIEFESRLGIVSGSAGAILKGERVALNFAQRLSGIATLTRKFVDRIGGTGVKICDTRKTTPLFRCLEKYAVRCGGGANHRFSLSDGVLVKDNAIKIFGSLKDAVSRVREVAHHLLKVEVEVENLAEFAEALALDVDAILLDNMSCEDVRRAVSLGKGKVVLEVSGNITLDNVREYAETGIDIISIGMLTHSAPAVDISFECLR